MLRRFTLLLFLAALVALSFTVTAQDLGERFTNFDETLYLEYPTDWVLWGGEGEYVQIGNSQAALEAFELESGQVKITIRIWSIEELAEQVGLSGEPTAANLMEAAFVESPTVEVTMQPSPLPEVGEDAVQRAWAESDREGMNFVVILDDSRMLAIDVLAPAGELADYEETVLSILRTIRPEPVQAGTAVVQWQNVNEMETSTLWQVTVDRDDNIYVTESRNVVSVMSADGEVLREFEIEAVSSITDIEAAPDGTLWIANRSDNQQIHHIDTEGNVLSAFGEKGAEPGQFGEYAPTAIEIDAEGNIYALNSYEGDDGTLYEEILIFDQEGDFLREIPLQFYSYINGELVVEIPEDASADDYRLLQSKGAFAITPAGNIYLLMYDAVLHLDNEGNLILEMAHDALLHGFDPPIEVSPDGEVYLIHDNSTVHSYDDEGNLVTEYGERQSSSHEEPQPEGQFVEIYGIDVLSNGDLILIDNNSAYGQITRVTLND